MCNHLPWVPNRHNSNNTFRTFFLPWRPPTLKYCKNRERYSLGYQSQTWWMALAIAIIISLRIDAVYFKAKIKPNYGMTNPPF
jgi:hypothetical protein